MKTQKNKQLHHSPYVVRRIPEISSRINFINRCIPETWDLKTAFLQGNALKRDIWILPPEEEVGEDFVCKLLKPMHCIASVTISCYDRFETVPYSCWFTGLLSDDGLFVISGRNGAFIVILDMRVDD